MKTYKYLYSLLAAAVLIFAAACSPDDYDMGPTGPKPILGTDFTVMQDASNPNLVHLTNLKTGYSAFWVHSGVGTGSSKGDAVDLQIAFPGSYKIVYGYDTNGGINYSDTVTVDITTMCADFVTGEAWTNLAGGAGRSKTWVPDNGNYGMKQGFYSCFDPTATIADMTHDEGKNNWYANGKTWWEPSNSDIGNTDADLAQTMTFSLQGSASVTVTDANGNSTTGTFAYDPTSGSLSANGVEFAHGAWANGKSRSFSTDFIVFQLDENQLMIANKRDPALSGEGECWYVWNFVSKDYVDNYNPGTYLPTLETGWRNFVEPANDKVITYKLTGFDWYNPDENTTARNVTGISAVSNIEDLTIELNSGTGAYNLTLPDGNTQSGTYTLSDDGQYKFTPALPSYAISTDGRAVFKSNSDGTMRILGFSQADNCDDRTGGLSNIVWGSEETDDQGNFYQYMGYKLEVVRAGVQKTYTGALHYFNTDWTVTLASDDVYIVDGTDADYTFTIHGADSNPYGVYLDILKLYKDHPNCDVVIKDIKVDGQSIEFDDNQIDRGTADGNGVDARRYIVNPWGATAGEASKYAFNSSLSVTVSVKMDTGTPFGGTASGAKKKARKYTRR